MGIASQLPILLWKCWKTTIRSYGWTSVQILFTLLLWFGLYKLSISDAKMLWENSADVMENPTTDLYEVAYKCDGLCNETVPDIRVAAEKVCPDPTKCILKEYDIMLNGFYNRLILRNLSNLPPVLNVDVERTEGSCEHFDASSQQFDSTLDKSGLIPKQGMGC
ncbi:hypothetical protein PMAYCL1PPCAC_30956, partial [Pristionchus mayeri]